MLASVVINITPAQMIAGGFGLMALIVVATGIGTWLGFHRQKVYKNSIDKDLIAIAKTIRVLSDAILSHEAKTLALPGEIVSRLEEEQQADKQAEYVHLLESDHLVIKQQMLNVADRVRKEVDERIAAANKALKKQHEENVDKAVESLKDILTELSQRTSKHHSTTSPQEDLILDYNSKICP